ncbi:hypothetical protein GCM10028778_15440 [Barrientosiimonas marina]|uniref:ABC-2 transporter permease n=1 Tax=Lentibacillus kimchii TaxID=1542911 RepID=A0ABW2USD3_9BACI
MKMLIKRELNQMSLANNSKYPVLINGLFVIGVPIILWLTGPGLLSFYDTEGFYSNVSIVGLVIVTLTVTGNIQREAANQQLLFLQTLPVSKSSIVNAKFISVLIFACTVVAWLNVVVLIYSLITDDHLAEYGMLLGYFSSLILFVAAILLLKSIETGSRNIFMTGIISIFAWGVVFFIGEFAKREMGMDTGVSDLVIFIGLSLAIYGLCWQVALQRVKKKGFPLDKSHKNHTRSLEGGG